MAYHSGMVQHLTPAQFIAKWSPVELSERAASQEHFIDLCRLLGQPTPAEHDATGAEYTFEKSVTPTGGASRGAVGERGFADVWWRGKFAWEYKRKGKYRDLAEAYRQLCMYREALENPPLLIVSDIARTEIHTNFTGTAKQVHTIELEHLDHPRSLDLLRRVFTDPLSLKPDITAARVTEDIARQFSTLAQSLRSRGHDAHTAAHFLMKCMFCLFAEDVGLLPEDLMTRLIAHHRKDPARLTDRLTELFATMRTGGDFGVEEVAHFNGSLFDKAPALRLTAADIDTLLAAARSDWGSVEPAIFGTLFERSLDPNTRAQIGAHYTSREDIMLIVEPVVMAPLRREWETVKSDVEALLEKRRAAKTKPIKTKADKAIADALHEFVYRLSTVRILDPACGSGNFLYTAIQQLLHLEKEVITYAASPEIALGLFPLVRPTQLHGIEINPYAAELAQVVIWIGYLQWMRDNGFAAPRDPILEPLQAIECRDAILEFLPHSVPEPGHSCPAELPEPPHSCGADAARHECRGSEGDECRGSEGRGGCYLLTWSTYGTWLPGDERGFVGRVPDADGGHVIHNIPGEPYDAEEPGLRADAERKIKGSAVQLTGEQARVCVEAFGEVCGRYGLTIHAGAVMANHVHLVVSSSESEGARLLNLFKGVSSRRLGQTFGRQPSGSWWTTGGSRRLLPNERAFDNAVNYVRNQEHMLAPIEFPSPRIHAGRDVVASPPGVNAASPPDMNVGAQEGDTGARAVPACWPDADFIIGNPPFLGSKLFRQQGLSDDYVDGMYSAFDLPKTSDLCCYWFELARRAIERNKKVRVGLLATQGIRGGDNRTVLERIKRAGDVFMAWSDREWILDGAAVHVSIIGFDGQRETVRSLDGWTVDRINADLTADVDAASARILRENLDIAYMGDTKGGRFDIGWTTARELLSEPNPDTRANTEVVRPWINGSDITKRRRALWIIDFGCEATIHEAAQFEAPLKVLEERVKPDRTSIRDAGPALRWWLHNRPRPALREAIEPLPRYVATPTLTKYRLFTWMSGRTLPDHQLIVFARSDDYFFGVLHSSIHELWARRMGTQLREAESGFRYTPTTCFETFPLPWSPGKEPCPSPGVHAGWNEQPPAMNGGARAQNAAVQVHEHISTAARLLNEQRERWLNPPEWIEPIAKAVDADDDFSDVPEEARGLIRQSAIMARAAKDARLKTRTLTNLYNERPTWLKLAHERLDRAVLAAYAATDPEGEWSEDWAQVWVDSGAGQPLPNGPDLAELRKETDQRVLANLLRLNLARAILHEQ
ncbi:MAG: transposase [Planctomycetes bacterium]|nr:transposase [Planctomycetota bacterium]